MFGHYEALKKDHQLRESAFKGEVVGFMIACREHCTLGQDNSSE